jgi:AcrR family transcriptional regulator
VSLAASRPLRRDAERNRQRVLAAARELFAERGLEVTLDDVARRAGLGVGTVYRRYPSRDALVLALFSEQLDALLTLAGECLRAENSWDGLVRFLEDFACRHGSDRAMRELLFTASGQRPDFSRIREELVPLADELVARAQRDGHLRADLKGTDLPQIELMISSVAEYTRDVDPEVWRRYLTLLLDGLRATPRGPSPLPVQALSHEQTEQALHRP